jgi:phosphoribosylaminoimidazole-succinocarboxamide synthase
MSSPVVLDTNFPDLTLARRGKVRDVYDLGDKLLIVATDRISAFDYVLGSGSDKGKVLTQLSAFWFDHLGDLVPHHAVALDVDAFPAAARPYRDVLRGRSMLVRKAKPLAIECVARGYLSGSGLKDYVKTGSVCGIPLPAGLQDSSRLPQAIFTPATKAESGHDENITEAQAADIVGKGLIGRLRELTLTLYERGVEHGATCGIIIADTKFEFGFDGDTLLLIDEVLTPDSSRFWPQDHYAPGRPQPSFDKVRGTTSRPSAGTTAARPSLPDEVVQKTRRMSAKPTAGSRQRAQGMSRCFAASGTRRSALGTSRTTPGREGRSRAQCPCQCPARDREGDARRPRHARPQMIDRGILFDDAQRRVRRTFITRALAKTSYPNVCKRPRSPASTATPSPARWRRIKSRKAPNRQYRLSGCLSTFADGAISDWPFPVAASRLAIANGCAMSDCRFAHCPSPGF